jgi:replication-associated recombination protein RarA
MRAPPSKAAARTRKEKAMFNLVSVETQANFVFPQALTEKYRPRTVAEFAGLTKPKQFCSKLAANPRPSAWRFVGPSGTGKTTMALALAEMIGAELHHVPSQSCNLETLESIARTCNYVPMAGYKFHLILVDEADQMSAAAQLYCLSKLDGTAPLPATIWIFTCNETDRLQDRFLSRTLPVEFSTYGIQAEAAALLARVWTDSAPSEAPAPNFARIVKEANGNVRESLMRLELELMLA